MKTKTKERILNLNNKEMTGFIALTIGLWVGVSYLMMLIINYLLAMFGIGFDFNLWQFLLLQIGVAFAKALIWK